MSKVAFTIDNKVENDADKVEMNQEELSNEQVKTSDSDPLNDYQNQYNG